MGRFIGTIGSFRGVGEIFHGFYLEPNMVKEARELHKETWKRTEERMLINKRLTWETTRRYPRTNREWIFPLVFGAGRTEQTSRKITANMAQEKKGQQILLVQIHNPPLATQAATGSSSIY